MPKLIDMTGQVFGRLTVLSRVQATGQAKWLCRCICGNTTVQPGNELRAKNVISCGCYKRANLGQRTKTHGMTKTPEYFAWINMRNRCARHISNGYERYGALGITVCDRWLNSFQNFYADMGPRPFGYSLDRINPAGNYSPENCRWASMEVQQTNKRRTIYATLYGETKPVSIWCKIFNIPYRTINARIYNGWEPEIALKTPIRKLTKN